MDLARTAIDEKWRARLVRFGPPLALVLLGTLIGLGSWSYVGAQPGSSFDASWVLGLQMALDQGVHFGPGVLFTYGPLGFLQAPVAVFSPYAELGGLYLLVIRIGLGVTLLWAARRAFGLWLAFPVALAAALILTQEPVIAIAMIWSLAVIGPEPPARAVPFFAPLAGIVAAIEMLGKLSIGPVILLVCLIAVVAMEGSRKRNLAIYAGSFLAATVVFWFATGQALGAIPDFVRGSYEVVSGYATAMPLKAAPEESIHIVAVVAMVAVGELGGYLAARGLPTLRRVAVALVILAGAFAVWKMAFVRFGPPTYLYLYPVMIAPWFAFPWRRLSLPAGFGGKLAAPALALFCGAAVVGFYFPLTEQKLSYMNPVDRLEVGVEQLETLLDPDEVDQVAAAAKPGLQATYDVPPRFVSQLRGHSVNVDPSEISIAWAYDLDWRPLTVFQAYSAYTPYLDQRNLDSLLADDGPERILRTFTVQPPQVVRELPVSEAQTYNSYGNSDGRFRAWDQPRTNMAMLCNYRAVLTEHAYQVLARTPDRCGEPRRIGETEAEFGEEVPVPAPPGPHEVVYAEVEGLAPHGIEKLRTLLYKAPQFYVAFNGAGPMQYRLLPTDGSDRILRAAPGSDFPQPFALAPEAQTLRFEKEAGRFEAGGGFTLTFYAMPVAAARP